ncbi:hypothetical protein RCJ22_09100, partial [Vibrio sp. FNV 38]|nr:hypothetical protein [Vibrio sp. FNV 38]
FGITKETDGLVDADTLNSYLQSSNRSVNGHPWLQDSSTGGMLQQRGTVRFDTTVSIPTYFITNSGNSVPAVILESVEVMRNQLGVDFSSIKVINEDLTPYRDTNSPNENKPNGSFNSHSFQSRHGINGGIIFSIDTAFYSHQWSTDPSLMCANAGQGPYDGGLNIAIDNNTHTFRDDTVVWVNLGNRQCSWDKGIVLHEMAHALGLFQHFDYFGKWNTTSMAVLKLLYRNAPGTPFDTLSH